MSDGSSSSRRSALPKSSDEHMPQPFNRSSGEEAASRFLRKLYPANDEAPVLAEERRNGREAKTASKVRPNGKTNDHNGLAKSIQLKEDSKKQTESASQSFYYRRGPTFGLHPVPKTPS